MIDYSGTMNVLGFNEVVNTCHPPDQNWCTGSSRITRPPLTSCRCTNLLYEYTASNAYDISFPPIGIYRAVLSLNITILKVWFPILATVYDLECVSCRIAMELYEAVSRRMGIPEVVIRGSMGYMRQSRIFVVTFLGILDPVQRILSTPQV